MILSGLSPGCSGLFHPKLSFRGQRYDGIGFENFNAAEMVCRKLGQVPRGRIGYVREEGFGSKYVAYAGRNQHELSYSSNSPSEPFLMGVMIKEALRALKSLIQFLVDQPSQLKYIEWPSFQSTLKTAVLTLVLVAVLIVALSSIDSALCFLLALYLRRAR